MYKNRIELNNRELELLTNILKNEELKGFYEQIGDEYIYSQLVEKIENPRLIKESEKKYNAALNATKAREKRTKKKIQNAINILRMENQEITPYRVSKVSGVSFQTAQKYLNTLNKKKDTD